MDKKYQVAEENHEECVRETCGEMEGNLGAGGEGSIALLGGIALALGLRAYETFWLPINYTLVFVILYF